MTPKYYLIANISRPEIVQLITTNLKTVIVLFLRAFHRCKTNIFVCLKKVIRKHELACALISFGSTNIDSCLEFGRNVPKSVGQKDFNSQSLIFIHRPSSIQYVPKTYKSSKVDIW